MVPEGDYGGAKYNLQVDLKLTDVQFGVVTGTAFTFTNGIAGLVFGHLADIYPRKWIWLIACVLWTLCTFMESFATNFVSILIPRMGFAIFMGSCVPVSISLLSDFTLPKHRGTAQSIFAAGVYLGVGMSNLAFLFDKSFG